MVGPTVPTSWDEDNQVVELKAYETFALKIQEREMFSNILETNAQLSRESGRFNAFSMHSMQQEFMSIEFKYVEHE